MCDSAGLREEFADEDTALRGAMQHHGHGLVASALALFGAARAGRAILDSSRASRAAAAACAAGGVGGVSGGIVGDDAMHRSLEFSFQLTRRL